MPCYPCIHCNKCGMYSIKTQTCCAQCGQPLEDDADRCPSCGCTDTVQKPVGKPEPAPPPGAIIP